MSEYDAHMYETFSSSVRRQVKSLRIIMDSLQVCNIVYQFIKEIIVFDLI